MAGKKATKPANATVLDAMMDDLGNHRIEELIRNDVHQSHHRPSPLVYTPSRNSSKQSQKRREDDIDSKRLSEQYRDAIASGLFDDDDAAGVSGLDPLDGGNAHRIPLGRSHNENQAHGAMGASSTRPKYDPSQPTYKRSKSGVGSVVVSRRPDGLPDGLRLSSLGGIIPDGGEVRRWGSGRQTSPTHHINNPILSRPAGRGRPVPAKGSLPGQPAQTARSGCAPDRFTPNPLQINKTGPEFPIQQPNRNTGQTSGELVKPGKAQTSSLHPVVTTPSEARVSIPISTPQSTPKHLAHKASNSRHQEPGTKHPLSRASSRLPPHLRKASASQATASNSRADSPRSLSQSTETTAQAMGSDQNNIGCRQTGLDAGEIFLQQSVLVLHQCGADNKPLKGRIVLYELADAAIGVWELTTEDKKASRGDIRELLEVLANGSTAYFRRRPEGGSVRSDPLRFSSVNEAEYFMKEVNFRRGQYSRSCDKIYLDTSVQLPPVQDTTTRRETDGYT
ncbi:hypothetical protein F4802DRAFT_298317 [Xylaria palmicola]|nr:hypothetical protein F4802DRAFT_298317 [Xylaria palmicola]